MNDHGFVSSNYDHGDIDYVKLYSTGVLEQSVDYLNDALYYRKSIPTNILRSNPFEAYLNRMRNHFLWKMIHAMSITCYLSVLIVNNSYYINNSIYYRIGSVIVTCACYFVLMLDVFMKWRLGTVLHPCAVSTSNNKIVDQSTNSSYKKHVYLTILNCVIGIFCFIELLFHAFSVYGLKFVLSQEYMHDGHNEHFNRLYRSDIWWGLAVCRVYFLATASETTQQSFICLFKGVYSASGMVFMQLSVVFIFSVVAVVLYGGGIEKHNLSYLYVAAKSMFILSTTSNNPDIWLPLYAQNAFNGLYFIVFLVISVLIANNVVTVSVYNGFVREMLIYMTRRRKRRLDSLVYSFQCLDIHGRHKLDGGLVIALLKYLRPHYNDDKIQYLYTQIDPRNTGFITQYMYCNKILHVLNLSVRSVYMDTSESHHTWVHSHNIRDELPSIHDILHVCWTHAQPWCVMAHNGCRIPSLERFRGWFVVSSDDSSGARSRGGSRDGLNETSPLIEIEMCRMPSPNKQYTGLGTGRALSSGLMDDAGVDTNSLNSYQQDVLPGRTLLSDRNSELYSNVDPGNTVHSVDAGFIDSTFNIHFDNIVQHKYVLRGILITSLTVGICLVNLAYVCFVCVNAHTFLTIVDNSHKELFLHIAGVTSFLSCCSILLFVFQTCVWYPWVKHSQFQEAFRIGDSAYFDMMTQYAVDRYHWLQYIFRNRWDILSVCASAITMVGVALMYDCVDDILNAQSYNINARAAMGIILFGRCLEILHIVRFIESLRGSFNSMFSVLPGFLIHLLCVLFTAMHIFACIGLQIFPSMPDHLAYSLKHKLIAIVDVPPYYEQLHFNTYISGLFTLSNILFVNNWNIVALMYENLYGKIGFLYFAFYYTIAVMFCLATITGYFVFAFVTISKHPLGQEHILRIEHSDSDMRPIVRGGMRNSQRPFITRTYSFATDESKQSPFLESIEQEYRSHREPYNQALNCSNNDQDPYDPYTCLQSNSVELNEQELVERIARDTSNTNEEAVNIHNNQNYKNNYSAIGSGWESSTDQMDQSPCLNTSSTSPLPYQVTYRSHHIDMLDDGAGGVEFFADPGTEASIGGIGGKNVNHDWVYSMNCMCTVLSIIDRTDENRTLKESRVPLIPTTTATDVGNAKRNDIGVVCCHVQISVGSFHEHVTRNKTIIDISRDFIYKSEAFDHIRDKYFLCSRSAHPSGNLRHIPLSAVEMELIQQYKSSFVLHPNNAYTGTRTIGKTSYSSPSQEHLVLHLKYGYFFRVQNNRIDLTVVYALQEFQCTSK